ncbi:MAG: aldose 1-epimerase family protein [Cellulosilyticaceae bacterium]
MIYTLKNDLLSVMICSKGAELCKFTDHEGINYLWSADAKFWPRHTPILFPLVGRVADGKYLSNNQVFEASQHGFARDMAFTLTDQTDTSLTFTLCSSQDTQPLYPFNFQLDVIYILEGKSLQIIYKVHNTDTQVIGFKLGAHPGFMCPLFEGEKMEDYYLEFEKTENALLMQLAPEGLLTDEMTPFVGQTIPLSPETFAKDALIFTGLDSQAISLCSHNHTRKLTVSFDGFPFLGIWSTATRSPFVCIEPWFGHTDFIDDSKEFLEKRDIVSLSTHETFECKHVISIS